MLNKKDFIVSCQALSNEPLHSSFIMSKMALAAKEGGANAIRANSYDDIKAIKKEVDLPVIGIEKVDYDDSEIYITPTLKEVKNLLKSGCEVIALDATNRLRPNNMTLDEFFNDIKSIDSNVKLMADCSTFEEMIYADKLGFDYIGTTLFGYTSYSNKSAFEDLILFDSNIKNITNKVIAEGQIETPTLASEIMKLENVYAVVVGGAITRPQNITKKFVSQIREENKNEK